MAKLYGHLLIFLATTYRIHELRCLPVVFLFGRQTLRRSARQPATGHLQSLHLHQMDNQVIELKQIRCGMDPEDRKLFSKVLGALTELRIVAKLIAYLSRR